MNDFLGKLAQRALAPESAIRPRIATPFEAGAGAISSGLEVAVFSQPPEPRVIESPRSLEPRERGGGNRFGTAAVPHRTGRSLVAPEVSPTAGQENDASAASPPDSTFVDRTAASPLAARPPSATRPAKPIGASAPTEKEHEFAEPAAAKVASTGLAGHPRSVLKQAGAKGAFSKVAPEDNESSVAPDSPGATRRLEPRVIRPEISAVAPAPVFEASGRPPTDAVASATPTPPDVHITIGRVEIRAVTAASRPRANDKPPPVLSLEEYLKRTAGGAR